MSSYVFLKDWVNFSSYRHPFIMSTNCDHYQALHKSVSRKFASVAYPAYILNAPLTEVSKTSNGVRVASEVCSKF